MSTSKATPFPCCAPIFAPQFVERLFILFFFLSSSFLIAQPPLLTHRDTHIHTHTHHYQQCFGYRTAPLPPRKQKRRTQRRHRGTHSSLATAYWISMNSVASYVPSCHGSTMASLSILLLYLSAGTGTGTLQYF